MQAAPESHPLVDKSGDQCTLNNPGSSQIFFAGGLFGSFDADPEQNRAFVRRCEIDSSSFGKINGIFFPILNSFTLEALSIAEGKGFEPTRMTTLYPRTGTKFHLPCGRVKNGECSNPELRNPDGTFRVTYAVKDVSLRVQKKSVTKELLKVRCYRLP